MNYSFLDFLGLLGSVGLFLYGMKVMSEGLQKVAGNRLRNILSAMTRNRFAGMITGFLITALIQSSSASIVMVVSFVNAGLMTLSQSMAVIFGANVGTTFTAWIISLFGFKVDISAFAVPLMALAIVLLFSSKGRNKSIGEFIIGFALLFLGLNMISEYVPDLQSNPEMFAFLRHYASLGFASVLIFMIVGVVVTMIIQSSAATFAICLIMFSKGWIDYDLACAIVLGSAVGTTITPILASLSGNIAAKRTAMGHLIFNIFGMVWCLALFYPFVHLVQNLCGAVGIGNPDELYRFVNNLEVTDPDVYNNLFNNALPQSHPSYGRVTAAVARLGAMQVSASIGLSLFYTIYKIINVSIMIWFTNQYVKIVEWLVPARNKGEEEFSLTYIRGGILSASELNITQAEKEIHVFAERVGRMINMARDLIHTKEGSDEFSNLYSRLEKYEDISDRMEIEIAHYLNRCSEGRLSNAGKLRIAALLRIVSEIESIADCCLGAGKILLRKQQSGAKFTEGIYQTVDSMFDLVDDAMHKMVALLVNLDNINSSEIVACYNREREINNYRNQLRNANIENINTHEYEYQAGIYYMDLISDLEKTGDYITNVVDAVKDISRSNRTA